MISHPFDASAATYDVEFSHTALGRRLRAAVHSYLVEYFKPGDRILELGCGTGEDALWLAGHGMQVIATDASPTMLEIARNKAQLAGCSDLITFAQLDFSLLAQDPTSHWSLGYFQGGFSNFGALNCLPDRGKLAQHLADWVMPGGYAIFVIMGPVCMWEIGWYLFHGDPRAAFRRFHSGIKVTLKNHHAIQVWYPSPKKVRHEFSTHFQCIRIAGIGVLLPPSYLDRLVDRFPNLFAWAARLDGLLRNYFPFYCLSDHYLIVFRKKP